MTEYHSSYFAHELSRRHSLNDSEKLASALADAQVDLNPHQLDAALFAFRSPLSKGSILADEVGLGKTAVRRFFDLPSRVDNKQAVNLPEKLKTETARRKKVILDEIAVKQADWFEEEIEKLNFWADDKRKGLKAELKDFDDEIALLKKEARLAANLPDKLAIQKKLRDLDKKRAGFQPTERVSLLTAAGKQVFSISSRPMRCRPYNARNMQKEKHNQIVFRTV